MRSFDASSQTGGSQTSQIVQPERGACVYLQWAGAIDRGHAMPNMFRSRPAWYERTPFSELL